MKVLVTGGTGFVGRYVVQALIGAGHEPQLLVRPGSEGKVPADPAVETVPGDVLDPSSLLAAINRTEAVVHLVGIIREFPKKGITFDLLHRQATFNMIAAIQAVRPLRYLHMSALGASEESVSPYHRTKATAELAVQVSGLEWTVFRPSLIYGPEDLSINFFAEQVRSAPLVPVIGRGDYLLQPVSVKTVARAFAQALTAPESIGKTFNVTGPEPFTYDEMLRTIGRVIGKKARLIHLPVWPIRMAARMLGRFAAFPLTEPQLDMLLAGNAADSRELYEILNLEQIGLEEGLSEYLRKKEA